VSDWNSEDTRSLPPERQNFLVRWSSRLFAWLRNALAIFGLVAVVIPLIIVWSFFRMTDAQKPAKTAIKDTGKPATLWLALNAPIMEHEPRFGESFFREIFGREEGIYLPTIRSALRKAAADKGIKDVQVALDGVSGSAADLEELRQMILDFKASGKPTHSWVAHLDNAALMIASATDKISLNPVAEVSLPGPAFPMTYFGDALRRLGVEMQVVRTGKFKSAFEPFIANEPSPESREALLSVEGSLRDHLVKNVAQGRKKQDSEVFLWFKESFFTPAKAKEMGIVDDLAYMPTIDLKDPQNVLAEDYDADESITAKLSKGYSLKPDEGLGFIEAVGQIVSAADGESAITPDDMEQEINWALNDDNVKAVILRISSPGGSASVADFIWDRVKTLNEKKPVVVSMGSVAASGGYYIAAGANRIFADPSTITGSIGVIGMLPSLDGMKDKWGVSFHTITQSNRGAVLGMKKMTSSDQSYLQATVEDVYRTFKSRVADGRKMSMEKVESLAQGRIYTGAQAKDIGLVDELGGLKEAFQYAKKVAGLDENRLYPIHRFQPEEFSLSDCFTSLSKIRKCFRRHGSLMRTNITESLLDDETRDVLKLQRVAKAAKESRVMAIMPVTPKL
jgi:protease-4